VLLQEVNVLKVLSDATEAMLSSSLCVPSFFSMCYTVPLLAVRKKTVTETKNTTVILRVVRRRLHVRGEDGKYEMVNEDEVVGDARRLAQLAAEVVNSAKGNGNGATTGLIAAHQRRLQAQQSGQQQGLQQQGASSVDSTSTVSFELEAQ
jgi:hypothetical protein